MVHIHGVAANTGGKKKRGSWGKNKKQRVFFISKWQPAGFLQKLQLTGHKPGNDPYIVL